MHNDIPVYHELYPATETVEVTKCIRVENAYALFMEYVKQGKMKVGRFEDKSEKHCKIQFQEEIIHGNKRLDIKKLAG